MLYGLLLFVHIVASVFLVIAVLLQSSKGGGLAGTFGGSGVSGGVFGGRGAAPFLVKATTVVAILFMVTSISLNFVSSRGTSESILERTLQNSGSLGSEPAVVNEMPLPAETGEGEQSSGTNDGDSEGASSVQTDNQSKQTDSKN